MMGKGQSRGFTYLGKSFHILRPQYLESLCLAVGLVVYCPQFILIQAVSGVLGEEAAGQLLEGLALGALLR